MNRSTEGPLVSVAEAASLLGVDRRRVYDYIGQGAPVVQGRPVRFALPELIDWYLRRRCGGQLPVELQQARAQREAARANLADLELEERRGELVDAEGVRREVFRLARQARDAMTAIPQRVAAQLAAEQDVRAVQRILRAEIDVALRDLAGTFRKPRRRKVPATKKAAGS